MLRHEEPLDQSQQAAQVRVTANELAEAVAAIEARREQEARAADDRIALGDAVQQLDLNVSPEELLAEIIARRNTQTTASVRTVRARKETSVLPAILRVGVLLFCMVIGWQIGSMQPQTQPTTMTAISPASRQLLSLVPDNTPVYASLDDIISLADGKSPQKTVVYEQAVPAIRGGPQWTLVKFRGNVFVHAWRVRDTGQFTADDRNWICSTYSEGWYDDSDMIPLKRFQNYSKPPEPADDSDPNNSPDAIYLEREE